MELVVRKNDLLRELQLFQGIVERKNTIPILANVLMEAKGEEVKFLATDLEVGSAQQMRGVRREGRIAHAAGEKTLRDRQVAAGNRHSHCRRKGWRQGRRRPLRLADADAATRGFSDATRRWRCRDRDAAASRAQGDGRQDAVCDYRRRHPLLPERGALRAARRFDEPGRDRRSPPGAREGQARRRSRPKTARRPSRSFRRRPSANSPGS